MINGFLKTIASLLMLCTVVSFASCRNDGDDEELGGGTTGQPPVITFDNGMGKTEAVLHALCPDSVNWKSGKMLNGYDRAQMEAWVRTLA